MLHSHPHPHARSPPREGERLPGSAATTKPALLLAPHKLGAPQVRPLPPPEFSAAKLLCRTRAQATLRASNPPPVPAGKLAGALPPRSGGFRIALSRPGPSRSPRGEAPIPFPPIPSRPHPIQSYHRGTHRRVPQALRAAAASSLRLPFSNFPYAERGCREVYLYGERERGSTEDDKLFGRVLNQKGGWNRISPQYQDPRKSNPSPEEHSFRAVFCITINARSRRHRIQIDPGSSLYWWLWRAPGSYCSGAGELQSASAASGHGLGGGDGG